MNRTHRLLGNSFGLIGGRQMGLFSRKPKSVDCLCGDELKAGTSNAHWRTHLVEVRSDAGHQAFAFKCPRCGMSDQA